MSSDKISIDSSVSDTFAVDASNAKASYDHLLGKQLTVNDEHILICEFLGAGNMAGVLKAVYQDGKNRGDEIALKILSPELSRPNSLFVERFRREAEAMKALPRHPNIIGCHFSGRDEKNNLHFIGLEYVEGRSLDLIEKPIPVDKAYLIAKQVARALVVAYNKDMIHRDVKPGNILVTSNWSAKLSDFGLVRGIGDVRQTMTGTALGTPLYMAPEQLRGRDNFSSDVYGLGATFYETLTGRPPYLGEDVDSIFSQIEDPNIEPPSLREFNGKISMELESLVLRTLAKDFKHRFLSAEEFLEELNSLNFVMEPENREAVENRKKEEIEKIIAKWKGIDVSRCRFDEQLKFITDWKRLLRKTVQSPDTVLKRIGWLEDMNRVWNYLIEEDPGRYQKQISTKYMLDWEENRRVHWGVEKPVPPKTFMEKHGKKILYSTMAGLVLALAGTIAGFVGYDLHQNAEKRRDKEMLVSRYNEAYDSLERNIKDSDFGLVDSGLKELRSIAGEDSDLRKRVDELEAKAKKTREDKEFADIYSASKKIVDSAYEKVEGSNDKSVRLEDRNRLLVDALALIEEFKKEEKKLKREHADELRERTSNLEKKVGDKLPALRQYGSAVDKFKEAEKQYSVWDEQLKKDSFFDRAPVVNLKEELSYCVLLLRSERVRKHFSDDPSYGDLVRTIQLYERNLTTLERDLSVLRFNSAKNDLSEVVESTTWLVNNYFLDDAEKRVKATDMQISRIEEHLKNINDIYLSDKTIEVFIKNFEEVKSKYQSAKPKFDEISALRKKAAEGDEISILALGRLFFDNSLLTDSKPYFERIKSEDLRKTAGVYLEIISLEAEIVKPENKDYRAKNGYDVYALAGFRKVIDGYDGVNEAVVMDNLRLLNKSGVVVDKDLFGELHEVFYLALKNKGDVEGAKKAVFDLLNGYYQKADEELQKQEATVRPELLERKTKLYDSLEKK